MEIRILDGLVSLVQMQSIAEDSERVLIKLSHQIRGMSKVNLVQDGTQPGNDIWI